LEVKLSIILPYLLKLFENVTTFQ